MRSPIQPVSTAASANTTTKQQHQPAIPINDCPVCFETKQMVSLACSHQLCVECLKLIKNSENKSCPMCRAPIIS